MSASFSRRQGCALCSCLIALGFAGGVPSEADGSVQSVACPRVNRFEASLLEVPRDLVRRLARKSSCLLVRVPLDYSGHTSGSIDLFVQRVPATKTPSGAIVALAGGPGEGASSLSVQLAAGLARVLSDRELIIFDQRGTGRSGALKCTTLEKEQIGPLGPAVGACAAALGPRRAYYTTFDSADDIETVRRELGLERLSLYGTSYGTKVSLAYAQRYPQRVERLLLDSLVPLDGPDPFTRDVFAAVPRVLRALCANRACRAATPDPVGDVAAMVKRLAATPLRGYVVGGDGKRRARRLGRLRLLRILIAGDLDPSLRAEFPASVRAALRGDEAPLLRLARRASAAAGVTEPRTAFSPALFVATVCEEGPLPWELVDPFGRRWARTIGQADTIPETSFFPFDRATGRASDILRLCAHWPANGSGRQPPGAPLPDVPALLLSGETDLRTSSEEARRVAALLPRATALTVPSVGHSVLINDLSRCSSRAVRRFFADQPNAPVCPRSRPGLAELFTKLLSAPTPLPPASLADVPRAKGVPGLAGRTLTAVELTFVDFAQQLLYSFDQLLSGRFRGIGGLRGGRFGLSGLDRYSYVPGVEITTLVAKRQRIRPSDRSDLELSDVLKPLRIRVTGEAAARGTVVFDLTKGRISGRLGGRRVRARPGFDLQLPPEGALPPVATTQKCCRFVR